MNSQRKRILHTLGHMKNRCFNPKCKAFKDYGGRGITVCDEWVSDPDSFVEWALSNGYEYGLAIDRIDNDGNYEPNNCRWVTAAENNQNRRSSRFFTINGETKNLQQWCNQYGISRSMVHKRLQMGWDIEKALTTPKRTRDKDALVGERFGRLTVLSYAGVDKHRYSVYECRCDCGNVVNVNANKLQTGHNRSCGCLKDEVCYNRQIVKSAD